MIIFYFLFGGTVYDGGKNCSKCFTVVQLCTQSGIAKALEGSDFSGDFQAYKRLRTLMFQGKNEFFVKIGICSTK